MLPGCLAKLPFGGEGHGGAGGELMDKCKPFTTNGSDNREQMLSSWLVSEIDFVYEGRSIFPVIWV